MSIAWFWGIVLPVITLSGWVYTGKLNLKPAADAKVMPWCVQLVIQVPWWASCVQIQVSCSNQSLWEEVNECLTT